MSKSRPRRILIKLLDRLFTGLAVCSVLLAFASHDLGRLLAPDIELPLSGIDAIAVDQRGNLYCTSRGYMRIQVYDKEGSFIEGLYIPMSVFSFHVDPDDCLHVWSNYKQYRKYNPDRQLAVQEENSTFPIPLEYGTGRVQEAKDVAGNTFEVGRWSWIWPYVTKTTPDGETRVLISQPLYLWLMRWPQPAWLYMMVVGVYFLLVRKVIGPQHPAQGDEQTESECAP